MPMSPEAAWKLVNALKDAARRHEAELLGTMKGYHCAVDDEVRAEHALVVALTGLSAEWAEFHRPVTPSEYPANLVAASDEDRETARQAAFGSAVANFVVPDDTNELANLVAGVA